MKKKVLEGSNGEVSGTRVTIPAPAPPPPDWDWIDESSSKSAWMAAATPIRDLYLRGNAGNPLVEVLQVDLVAELLFSNLNLEDLKSLSEAAWGTMNAVRKAQKFSELARLHLSLPVLRNGFVKLSGGRHFFWKHVSMNLIQGTGVNDGLTMYSLKKHLEEAESLKVYLGPFWKSKDLHEIFHRLGEVLKRTGRLRTLGLEVGILNYPAEEGWSFFGEADIQDALRGLHALIIHGKRDQAPGDIYQGLQFCESDDGTSTTAPICQNLLKFAKAHLRLKKFSFVQRLPADFVTSVKLKQFLAPLIIASRWSLEVLEYRYNNLRLIEMIQFPRLKALKFAADGRFMNRVEKFLTRQPPLEELDIYLRSKCDFWIPQGLVMSGKLRKLKRLHLSASRSARADAHNHHDDDEVFTGGWRFLQWIPTLKDFSLTLPNSIRCGTGQRVLANLPPSVEKISLKDIWHFWDLRGNIGLALAPFKNLRELDLAKSLEGVVTDIGLQTLIVNCPKLTLLSFTDYEQLTDYGLTGVRKRSLQRTERTGVSLDQLKDLVHLKIRGCVRVSRECLLQVIKFEQLRSFEYHRWVPFKEPPSTRLAKRVGLGFLCKVPDYPNQDREFLYSIVRQNPALEKVELRPFRVHSKSEIPALKKMIREFHPRLKVLNLLELEK